MKSSSAEAGNVSGLTAADLVAITPLLRGYARKILRSDSGADDLVQDTLERAWGARHGFRPGADLKPWIFRILRNAIIDRMRRQKHATLDVDVANATRLAIHPDQLWRLQLSDTISAFETLTPDQRQALVLVLFGATTLEAADEMGCPLGTLKSHLRLARRKLRAAGV